AINATPPPSFTLVICHSAICFPSSLPLPPLLQLAPVGCSLLRSEHKKMTACVSKGNGLGFPYLNEHPPKPKPKEGISTILGCDCDSAANQNKAPPPPPTLRRNLSADMSSKKWLAQNGFSTRLKKIASSEELQSLHESARGNSSSSSSEREGEERSRVVEGRGAFDAIWKTIQEEQRKKELENAGKSDIWSSILTQKANDEKSGGGIALPPPYVHPLVRKSASSLSEKSLEVCTESLGSETGSDGFSSYPPSEPGDSEEDKEEEETPEEEEQQRENSRPFNGEEFQVVKYNYPSSCKRTPRRSFPPPLPSLGPNHDGSNVHMWSHRENGRLVVEAVAVPSQNCFRAQRQDGRLLLTLTDNTEMDEENYIQDDEDDNEMVTQQADNNAVEHADDIEEVEKEANDKEEEVQEEDEGTGRDEENNDSAAAMELANLMERMNVRKLPAGMMNVHKLTGLTKTSTWPHKFNKVVTTPVEAQEVGAVVEEDDEVELVKSLLPSGNQVARLIFTTPAPTTATLNGYEYYWRSKQPSVAATAAVLTSSKQTPPPLKDNKYNSNKFVPGQNVKSLGEQQEMVIKGEKAECVVPAPALRNCKEQKRRTLLFREPCCIATS
ncbi:hypothetical protein Ancab_011346, partial [Ancistrocladus abbreviatus]